MSITENKGQGYEEWDEEKAMASHKLSYEQILAWHLNRIGAHVAKDNFDKRIYKKLVDTLGRFMQHKAVKNEIFKIRMAKIEADANLEINKITENKRDTKVSDLTHPQQQKTVTEGGVFAMIDEAEQEKRKMEMIKEKAVDEKLGALIQLIYDSNSMPTENIKGRI